MHRKVEAGRGAGWIADGFSHLKSNGGVFASLGLLMGFLSSLPLLSILIGLLTPVLHAGMVSAYDSSRRGETPTLGQLFDGISRPGAFGRLFPLVLVMLIVAVVAIVLLLIAVGPALFSLIAGGGEPDPDKVLAMLAPLFLVILILFPVGVVFGWMMFLAVPRAMLEGVSGFTALRESFAAIGANIGAFIVNLLCWIALVIVMMIPLMVLGMLFGILASAAGELGQLFAQVLLGTLFGAVYAVIYTASMYQAWLEIHAPTDADEAQPPAALEA
ncbi:MAG: BPSS1780 family membrane protein [Lysobacteraceae bacterium]